MLLFYYLLVSLFCCQNFPSTLVSNRQMIEHIFVAYCSLSSINLVIASDLIYKYHVIIILIYIQKFYSDVFFLFFSIVYKILSKCYMTKYIYLINILFIVHKAHREELEQVLQLLEKVLTLLPELLNRRWQCHSLARILQKLLHPGNSWKLRREAIRYVHIFSDVIT